MGYCGSTPMGGDYPWDMQDILKDNILYNLNRTMLDEFYNSIEENPNDIDLYDKYRTDFNEWFKKECLENEIVVLNEIKTFLKDLKEIPFMRRDGDYNTMYFVIPLSFLQWEVKLEAESELSKYLLELLNKTDGGSKYRGYKEEENLYPNGIATPNDFIKAYIDRWNSLITGEIDIEDIKSTKESEKLCPNSSLINTR